MRSRQLLQYFILFLILFMPCCQTIHETGSSQGSPTGQSAISVSQPDIPVSQPKMSLKEAITSIKRSIKDTVQDPFWGHMKVVADVNVSEDGITLINDDNTKRYYDFNSMVDPTVILNNFTQMYAVKVKTDLDVVEFSNRKSAVTFADALYFLKHVDINKQREGEIRDCLSIARQTPIDSILAGATAANLPSGCSGVPRDQLESILNEIIVNWKSRGLPERLQKSSISQLTDMIARMENGILKLDYQIKKAKDIVDENALQATPAKGSAEVLSLAHLLEQRKTVLLVILGTVKQVISQKASMGRD